MNSHKKRTVELQRVVITGLGAVTPLGNTVTEFWNHATAGISGAGTITRFDVAGFKTRFACEVKNFDPRTYFDAKEVRKLDPCLRYALVAADEAIADARLVPGTFDPARAGVIWASGVGGLGTIDEQICEYAAHRGTPRFSPFFITRIITNMGAGMIAIRHGLRGISFATVSACASSAHALADALTYLRLGKTDLIVAGGAEAVITESGVGGFNAMKALSERNDDPALASRPFDRERDGFVIGEGAGALVLETLDHALRRGAPIHAEVTGAGFATDAYHITAPHPEGEGAYQAMKNALDAAGLTPEAIDYLNAHATSTHHGDISEIRAIARLFGSHLPRLSISATKSMTGHLLGAAGATEAILCVKALEDGLVPPTINSVDLDSEVPAEADLTLKQACRRPLAVAMSNTFGFGGHNVILIFQKYTGA